MASEQSIAWATMQATIVVTKSEAVTLVDNTVPIQGTPRMNIQTETANT